MIQIAAVTDEDADPAPVEDGDPASGESGARPWADGRAQRAALAALRRRFGRAPSVVVAPTPRLSTPLPVAVAPDRTAATARPGTVVLGPVDLAPTPYLLDLTHDDVLVLGPPRSGRSTALALIAEQVFAGGGSVWAVGHPRSPLGHHPAVERWWPLDRRQPLPVDEILAAASTALGPAHTDTGTGVAEAVTDGPPTGAGPPPLRLLLIDGMEELDDPVHDQVGMALAGLDRRVVGAGTGLRGYTANALAQQARRARTLILLGPPPPLELHELAGRPILLRPGLAPGPGRAVVVDTDGFRVVQIADGLTAERGARPHTSGRDRPIPDPDRSVVRPTVRS